MTEKTGLSRLLEHRHHPRLVLEWPAMLLPWTLIALVAVFVPFFSIAHQRSRRRAGIGHDYAPHQPEFVWLPWSWGVGNLALFCGWSVAKPNYYIPCLPGMALLIGWAWITLARMARRSGSSTATLAARGLLQAHWVLTFVAALVAPVVMKSEVEPGCWHACVFIGLAIAAAVVSSVHFWRRGATAVALSPLAAACVIGLVIAYGSIAPHENPQRGHRALAQRLTKLVGNGSPDQTLMFFNEIDEGLWFYAQGFALAPVPGSQPQYNTAFDLARLYREERHHSETLLEIEASRLARDKQALVNWLDQKRPEHACPYVLIRARLYDRFAADLAGRAADSSRDRPEANELVVLAVAGAERTAPSRSTSDDLVQAVGSVHGPSCRVVRQVFVSEFAFKTFIQLGAFASQPSCAIRSSLSRSASRTARLRSGNTPSATRRSSLRTNSESSQTATFYSYSCSHSRSSRYPFPHSTSNASRPIRPFRSYRSAKPLRLKKWDYVNSSVIPSSLISLFCPIATTGSFVAIKCWYKT